jgi:hypothetical protein
MLSITGDNNGFLADLKVKSYFLFITFFNHLYIKNRCKQFAYSGFLISISLIESGYFTSSKSTSVTSSSFLGFPPC